MLKAGWATVYSQSGAEYGDAGEEQYKRVEQEAKFVSLSCHSHQLLTLSYIGRPEEGFGCMAS